MGNLTGGFAAMLVALPSAIAYGLIIFAPLGQQFTAKGAVAGIIGSVVLGIIAPIFGGTKRLVSSPCAPAAAVLSVFAIETVSAGNTAIELIPLYIYLIAFGAGLIQLVIGFIKGGTFIKYIPYPVVAGYLSSVGILIFIGQFPRLLGIPKDTSVLSGVISPGLWRWESILVGMVTIIIMLITPKVMKQIPASIAALAAGICCYFILAFFNENLLLVRDNSLIIGSINVSPADIYSSVAYNLSTFPSLTFSSMTRFLVPTLTLGVLLSIDTLKTCVVLDVITGTRHDSNRELVGQGVANMASAFFGGSPGSGTMGGTLVNIYSGGITRASGIIAGISSLIVLVLFVKYIAWIPLASLAGVLLVVGVRMVDRKSLQLLRHRSTIFDFIVILAVVIAALSMSLIAAAAVGISLAIALFLREQLRFPVVRRIALGNQIYSKKSRLSSELEILEIKGKETLILELQGQLFFGTTDQLYTRIEPYIGICRYFILDMRRVLSVDFTAANMLTQIKSKITENGGLLIFASVPQSVPTGQNVRRYLETLGFLPEDQVVIFFHELDNALEWVEDELLIEYSDRSLQKKSLNLSEFEFFKGASDKALSTLSGRIQEKVFTDGEKIFTFGDAGGEIYFIKKGGIRIELPLVNGTTHHLASFGRGDFFGDMSFLNLENRSADAMAIGDVELYVMKRENFDVITAEYPEIAGIFYYRLACEIARRLRLNLIELKTLEEN
ncbi:MAG: SLC26A/SulP transporter family protein [Spirochaetes bacterium]|jgi:SulP family sulfate permease|nr:SLC26A/SulP transporter family protein [Spirochaetota bacterium]